MNRVHFAHFSEKSRDAIKWFCNRINTSDAEVFILMARKSVCFIKLLIESGRIKNIFDTKLVIADSSLDFPWDYLRNKKVAIVDDIMISGTSIAKVTNKLIDAGINTSDISVIVLATDRKYNKMSFCDFETGNVLFDRDATNSFDDPECIQLSHDIARMIALSGNSYNTDFPEFRRFEISGDAFDNLFDRSYWDIYDVSNTSHKAGKNQVYTFIPHVEILEEVSHRVGFDVQGVMHLKLRIIAHEIDGTHFSCILVPLAILDEISFEKLNEIWHFILRSSGYDQMHGIELGISAIARLVQFLMPKILADLFISHYSLQKIVTFDESCVPILFGYQYNDEICSLVNSLGTQILHDVKKISLTEISCVTESFVGEKCGLGAFDINARLLEPFSYWYNNKELSVRNAILQRVNSGGSFNFRKDLDALYEIDSSNRLNTGYSFHTLCGIIADASQYYDIPAVVSVFLDRAIDMGIIVPTNYVENNYQRVCRCYRHGEDFPFSKADQAKVLCFFQELDELLPDTIFGKVSFEKIAVLFMQLANKRGGAMLFNEFEGFDNHELLTVKYCIHGAVLVNVKQDVEVSELHPYVEDNSYTSWLVEQLIDRELVGQKNFPGTTDNGLVINEAINDCDETDHQSLTEGVRGQIKVIARLISDWYLSYTAQENGSEEHTNSEYGTKGFKDDITMLTSCMSLDAFAGSLLAELHYSLLDLDQTVFGKLLKNDENNVLKCAEDFDLYFGKEMNARGDGRKYNTHAFLAMYNGIQKALQYYSGGPQRVIKKVKQALALRDKYAADLWSTYYEGYEKEVVQVDSFLVRQVYECITYLYIFYISYATLHNLAVGKTEDIATKKFREEFFSNFSAHAKENGVNRELAKSVEELYQGKKYSKLATTEKKLFICNYLRKLEGEMKRNCQDIEMHISEESLQYVEKYHSLTLITIPYDVADELYRVLDKAKENVRLVQWTPNQAEMVKEFALFSKSNSELERIQRVITQEAKGKGYNLHFVTFEDIPTQVAAKYNVRTSSKRLQLSFQDRVVSLLGVDTENFEKSYFISGQRLSETKLVELDGCFPFEQNGEKNVIANVSENILYITSFSPKLITGETAKCESNTKKEETSMSQGTNQFSLNAQGDIHFQISPKQVDFSGNNNMYAEASEGSTITQIRDNTPAPIDYEKVASVLNQIQKYEPTFLDECGEQRGAAQAALENAEEAVRTKDDSKLKKALQELKSFALGVGSSLVASGIVGLLKELPFLA